MAIPICANTESRDVSSEFSFMMAVMIHTTVIPPAHGRQGQGDSEFETSLGYVVKSHYGLNVKYPAQIQELDSWSPASGTVQGC